MSPGLFPETLAHPGLTRLPGFAADEEAILLAAVQAIAAASPFRIMATPSGKPMSAAITNCGAVGWITDRRGYRYSPIDPVNNAPWPPMPARFSVLAARAAAAAGFPDFMPDACLINRYIPGAKMTLHQDIDEQDFSAPIVSLSLGLPAVFLWGGPARTDKTLRIPVRSGDILVWGGNVRRYFHGILPVKQGLGDARINVTFRKAL